MWTKLRYIWKSRDLRRNILFTLLLMVIFRFAAHIPIPGINIQGLRDFFSNNQILGLVNVLSGSAMENFSIVAMGVGPYITSSIIMQLLTMVVPSLEALSKEGEYGRNKINQMTRYLTVPLAILQSFGMIKIIQKSSNNILGDLSPTTIITTMIIMTAGTVFLMWLGEIISERKIGNGVSLIIFAGIVSGIPSGISKMIQTYEASQLINIFIFIILGLVTIAGIVTITEAQRNIPVSYAKVIRGNRMYGGANTFLPLRVNQAGMIPLIFAISLVLLPPLMGQFLMQSSAVWLQHVGRSLVMFFNNQWIYGIFYFCLVVAFTYFYTSVIFHPQQIADNLQKQGGFIPGIRPGSNTSNYLQFVSTRIMLAGALFLGLIAVLPLALQPVLGMTSVQVSGASLIIVVSVVIETMNQINSQLTMRDYDKI